MKRIYLIGYMGSGKSTVGRKLARKLDLQFIDLDDYIEERNHKTIPELFAYLGEEGFREAERKALQEVSRFENIVVATGGGTPCFFDNMDIIRSTGISVYLNGTPRILAERLMHSKTERPLIKGKTEEELTAFIHETLAKREKWYLQADVVLDFEHDLTMDEVMKRLA
ncbi:MAG TPA: shikimate kinase [Prolixibacteraceae bacterium]|nr:shikimate kinase [Prolixibacteraceae bacterium]